MWNNLLHHRKAGLPPAPIFSFWNVYIMSHAALGASEKEYLGDDTETVFAAQLYSARWHVYQLPWHLVKFADQGVAADAMDV